MNTDNNNNNKKAVAYAWSRYYSEVDRNMELSRQYCELLDKVNNNSELPQHIIDELKELYKMIKKEIECPICMDPINNENLKITSCGHKYCINCYDRIDCCAICRKKIYKKS